MQHTYVFGLLSDRCTGQARKFWNGLLREQGIDGFFDFYPTKTKQDLELRLSEMFHLERRAYVIGPKLRSFLPSLLDRIDPSAQGSDIDAVINDRGVLIGFHLGEKEPLDQLAQWIGVGSSVSH